MQSGFSCSSVPLGSFSLLPLNIVCALLRGQSVDTKSDTTPVPKDTTETFAECLQHQRTLTREEFVERIRCSVPTLRKIEYGVRRPSAQIAELMANCIRHAC